jgi:hypothetical protein
METSNRPNSDADLTYAHQFCQRLLRRPCTGWHRRLLRARCGSQVERRKRLWMRFSVSTRRASESGMLHLVGQTRTYPQES